MFVTPQAFGPLSSQTLGNWPGDNVTTAGCLRLYKGTKAFKVESSVSICPAFFYSFIQITFRKCLLL